MSKKLASAPAAVLIMTAFLSAVSAPMAIAADCSKDTPIQCFTDGLQQIQAALGRVAKLESDIQAIKNQVAQQKSDTDTNFHKLSTDFSVLQSKVPTLALHSVEFVVYSSGLVPPDAFAKCADDQNEILVGGSCVNRAPNVPVGNNQVGLGPVFTDFNSSMKQIRCQRYGDQNLRAEAFAICMRLKK